MTLKAVYRVSSKFEEQKCEKVKEDDHGIHLMNERNNQIGYIPYESLSHVIPVEDE